MNLNTVLSHFVSKKLVAALIGAIGLLIAGQYVEAAGLIGAYVLAQAGVDYKTANSVSSTIETEAPKVISVAEEVKAALLKEMAKNGTSTPPAPVQAPAPVVQVDPAP